MSGGILQAVVCRRATGRPLAVRRGDRRRRRRTLWLAPALLLAVAAAFLGARWLLTSERFAVRRVESGPYRFTASTQLEPRLAVALGTNIWTGAGARRLAADLAKLPWVRRVRVGRELPGTLRVEIEEWRPLLRIAAAPVAAAPVAAGGEPGLVLLGDGRLEPLPAHLPPPDLPWLVGARIAVDESGGRRLAAEQAGEVLALVAAVLETGLEAVAPVDFLVTDAEGLSVVLQGGWGQLLLGREEFPGRLRRFLAVSGRLGVGAVVDLRFDRRVFVDGRPAGEGAGTEGGQEVRPAAARATGRAARVSTREGATDGQRAADRRV